MLKKSKILLVTLISLVTLAGLVSLALAQDEWQEPEFPPPLGQVPAPINVGSDAQTKVGKLTVKPAMGTALEAISTNSYGLWGTGRTGVRGEGLFSSGVYGHGAWVGVYGTGPYGIYGVGSPWAGYFEGNVNVDGELCISGDCITDWSTTGLWEESDNKLYPKNITDWNVGIGTASPDARLDLGGPPTGFKFMVYNDDKGTQIGLGVDMTGSSNEFDAVFPTSAAHPGSFRVVSRETVSPYTLTPRLTVVGQTGNVGIGTTSPAMKLHVKGADMQLDAAGDKWFYYKDGEGGGGSVNADAAFGWRNSIGALTLWTPEAGDVLVANNQGNVGIGTTNPGAYSARLASIGNAYGVYGRGSTAGVYGYSPSGYGLSAYGPFGGVHAYNDGLYTQRAILALPSFGPIGGKGVFGKGHYGVLGWTNKYQGDWGEAVVGVATKDGSMEPTILDVVNDTDFNEDVVNKTTAVGVLGRQMGSGSAGVWAISRNVDTAYGGMFRGIVKDKEKTAYGVHAFGGVAPDCRPKDETCEYDTRLSPWVGYDRADCSAICNPDSDVGKSFIRLTCGGFSGDICGGASTTTPVKDCPDDEYPCGENHWEITQRECCDVAVSAGSFTCEDYDEEGDHLDCVFKLYVKEDYTRKTWFSGTGTGVYASGGDYGVYAITASTDDYGKEAGHFEATKGTGVYGRSAENIGVKGQGGTAGVWGVGDYGGYFEGKGYFSGNVGIGTASPASDSAWASPGLDISGTRGTAILRTTSANGIATLRMTGPGASFVDDWHINMRAGSASRLDFSHRAGSVTPVLTLTNDGNVGIGTATPETKLHVAGDVKVTGSLGLHWVRKDYGPGTENAAVCCDEGQKVISGGCQRGGGGDIEHSAPFKEGAYNGWYCMGGGGYHMSVWVLCSEHFEVEGQEYLIEFSGWCP